MNYIYIYVQFTGPFFYYNKSVSANILRRSQRKRRAPTSHIDNTPSTQKTQKHRGVVDATSTRAPAEPPRLIMDQPMSYSVSPITKGSAISSMIINTTAILPKFVAGQYNPAFNKYCGYGFSIKLKFTKYKY